MKITILGCGSSSGVPMIGYGWGNCNPNNIKNNRTRSSILIEEKETKILIDASPDFRRQCFTHNIGYDIDTVLFTHTHADHCHGIDDLRWLAFKKKSLSLPIYGSEHTINELKIRFSYLFKITKRMIASYGATSPILKPNIITGKKFKINDISILSMAQDHGFSTSLGFRLGNFAYSTDFVSLTKENCEDLKGLELWIVDCLQFKPHKTHCHLEKTLNYIRLLKPKRAVLTHMGCDFDYVEIQKFLMENVEPAYDGMVLNLP